MAGATVDKKGKAKMPGVNKPARERREKWIKVRCTEDEYKVIRAKSQLANLSMSDMCRLGALNANIEVRSTVSAAA